MLPDERNKASVAVLGAGCAGLSLAAQLASSTEHDCRLMLVEPRPQNSRKDHCWGFWAVDGLEKPAAMARKQWQNWRIIDEKGEYRQQSTRYPYTALESKAWLSSCRSLAKARGITIHQSAISKLEQQKTDGRWALQLADGHQSQHNRIIDSRPPVVRQGAMLQHFLGLELRTLEPVFEPEIVTLMDFRCDQQRGIHFIYVLPWSADHALVESTLFSPQTEPSSFYENAITNYLAETLGASRWSVLRREAGVIPMADQGRDLSRHDPRLPGLGGNGGAIRPSSGYAFGFIQEQIRRMLDATTDPANDAWMQPQNPHRILDRRMDRVLLDVLQHRPNIAPRLFTALGRCLNGDDMALFLSGQADHGIRRRVIMAMPPMPFILSALAGSWRLQ